MGACSWRRRDRPTGRRIRLPLVHKARHAASYAAGLRRTETQHMQKAVPASMPMDGMGADVGQRAAGARGPAAACRRGLEAQRPLSSLLQGLASI